MINMGGKTLIINWENPLNRDAYTEIGKLMVLVLPYVINIEIVDTEGCIMEIDGTIEDEIKELSRFLKYVEVSFAEE
ncbi:SIFV.gp17-like protein [Sulfolobus islandicus filamentous virus 2]|uniref:SIFV.gp17-like protein n=1 Tax=Sulfolobus islandicus filamentous virus 2 TaxID=1902331 RepID=A0A1D8BJ73_SIFV|nr:SIFV.gp17-like protein [Sulfolobus islandicus filamentous virus 2]